MTTTLVITNLDRICTHLIVYEGDSIAKMHIGNGSAYETMV
jgi:hypothetical protein